MHTHKNQLFALDATVEVLRPETSVEIVPLSDLGQEPVLAYWTHETAIKANRAHLPGQPCLHFMLPCPHLAAMEASS